MMTPLKKIEVVLRDHAPLVIENVISTNQTNGMYVVVTHKSLHEIPMASIHYIHKHTSPLATMNRTPIIEGESNEL